ncbi:acid protease [Auriculariales sp. MPI-PUGE-AT-0066]|nr:acid protease [Auriculariales sp. MPI-PUGE-AT-0066]
MSPDNPSNTPPPPPKGTNENADAIDPSDSTFSIVSLDVFTRDMNLIAGKYRNAGNWLRGIGLADQSKSVNVNHITDDLGALDKTVYGVTPAFDYGRDLFYYGPVTFGSSGQTLNISIDTGSSDLWVKTNCRNCTGQQFNPSKSRTYRNTGRRFQIQYGTGSASGTLAQDTITIGGLSIPNHYFGAVSSTTADFNDSPESGLIGMAFSSIATSGKPTFFEHLMHSDPRVGPLFSVHMTRRTPTGSEVCLGCYDTRKARSGVVWLPVVSKTYWTVAMSGAVINDRIPITSGELFAAIDTGTTLIYVPSGFARAGYWAIPCDSMRSLSISLLFGSTPFQIDIVDFNLGRLSSSSPYCACAILGLGDNFPDNLAIVGVAFLKSWYSTYDYTNGGRVGLSRSTN